MWNLSYGQVAAGELEAAHDRAAHANLLAHAPSAARGRHPLRQAVGELLIRVGARLVMPSTPSTPSAAR